MAGVVTRMSRTQIVVRDTETGAITSDILSGLQMGANYASPRGAKWLMNNRLPAASPTMRSAVKGSTADVICITRNVCLTPTTRIGPRRYVRIGRH